MSKIDIEHSLFKKNISGERISIDEFPTLYIYGLYAASDESKTIYTPEQYAMAYESNLVAETGMYYQAFDENQIKDDYKTQLISPKVEYVDMVNKEHFIEENVSVKAQGDGTLKAAKKSLKFKFAEKHYFRDHGHIKNVSIKSDTTSASHTIINGIGNLWRQMMSTREDYETLPEEIKNSRCKGALLGIPVKVFYVFEIDGETIYEYFGIYNLVNKKGDALGCFDAKTNLKAMILSNCTMGNTGRTNLCSENSRLTYPMPLQFTKLWTGQESSLEGGFEFEDGDKNFRAAKVRRVNQLISHVLNDTDTEFKTSMVNEIDLTSFFDFLILTMLDANPDAYKNMLLYCLDYENGKFFATSYDNDNSYFSTWDVMNATTGLPVENTYSHVSGNEWSIVNHLLDRILCNFTQEIIDRYNYLKTNKIMTSDNVSNTFIKEFIRYNKYAWNDSIIFNEDGDLVYLPEHSTVKFSPYEVAWNDINGNGSVRGLANGVITKIGNRFIQLDYWIEHLTDYYPYATITKIEKKQDIIDLNGSSSSINIFDYFNFTPKGNYIHNSNVYNDLVVDKILDTNGIINTIAKDGTITFNNVEGECKIAIYSEQLIRNKAQESRVYQYAGRVMSDYITIKKYTSNATNVTLSIVNGKPMKYGKEVIIEASADGNVPSYTWNVSSTSGFNGTYTPRYTTDGNRLIYITQPFEEEIIVTCTTVAGSSVLSFTTEDNSRVYDKENVGCITATPINIPYADLTVEGEFVVHYGNPGDGNGGNHYVFGATSGTITYANILNSTSSTHDECSVLVNTRRFKDKTYAAYQFYFGTKMSCFVTYSSTTGVSTNNAAIQLGAPISSKFKELIHFKMTNEYLQVNGKYYPWTIIGKKAKNTNLAYPLMLFGINKAGSYATSTYIKQSIYWLKMYNKSTLVSHIVPNTTDFESSTTHYPFKDLVLTSNTFNCYANSTKSTMTMTYGDSSTYLSPMVAKSVTVISDLPIENTADAVPFDGTNFIETGIKSTDDMTYEVVFKPMFNQTAVYDYRSLVVGSSTNRDTGNVVGHSISACDGGQKYILGAVNTTAYASTVQMAYDTVYKVKFGPTIIEVRDENDTVIYTKNITRRALTVSDYLIITLGGSRVTNSTAVRAYKQGFFGYIYSFKLSDSSGTLMDLTPNTKHTGFIDAISGKELLVKTEKECATLTNNIEIDLTDNQEISGQTYQLNLTSSSALNVIGTGCVMPNVPATHQSVMPCPLQSLNKDSKFIWKLANKSDEVYAEISDDGLMTIYESAYNTPITVRCYWSLDDSIYDEKDIIITYNAE